MGSATLTVVEDFSEEGLACITDILRSRVERLGECQISTRGVSRILTDRFGLSSGSVRFLTAHVIHTLERQDILKLWDKKSGCNIYEVIAENVV